jgi:hypothetical protein
MAWLIFGSAWLVEVVFVLSITTLLDMADRRQQASI